MTAPAPTRAEEAREDDPAVIAAAWGAWRIRHPHERLGPGPGFREAIAAALSVAGTSARAEAEVARLTERVAALERALKPFAEIKPSSFYTADGIEAEGYRSFLHEGPEREFTGADLAAARAALHGGENDR